MFVHLQSLDESIAWSKSAMNARCRLCRKKGDAEKMLLCDKCDNGHHMYCLRPQLKEIPDGQWFCPECRPKDVERTPRKIRDSFKEDEEESGNESERTAESDEATVETEVEESEETEAEEEGEETETGVETQESTAEEDVNDSDYGTEGKFKFSGFKIGRKKKAALLTDEEMAEESYDEGVAGRKQQGRKRKVTGEEKRLTPSGGGRQKAGAEVGVSLSGRSVRGRKPVYAEVSEEDGLTETDEEVVSKKRRKGKKVDSDTGEWFGNCRTRGY